MGARGKILYISRAEACARALSQINAVPPVLASAPFDAGNRPIAYRLKDANGGFDPTAPHCASWSYGDRTPTADCVGFVLWSSGIDRMQPGYHGTADEWLSCYSLLDDADGAKRFCRPLAKHGDNMERAQAGDWLVTPDHIGFVIRPELVWTVTGGDGNRVVHKLPLLVIDCSPRHGWDNSIQFGESWSSMCRMIRPLIYAESKPATTSPVKLAA